MSRTSKTKSLRAILSILCAAVLAASPGTLYAKGKPDKPGDGGGNSGTPNAPILASTLSEIYVTDGTRTTRVALEATNGKWTPDGSGFVFAARSGSLGVYFQAFDNVNGVASGTPVLIKNTSTWVSNPDVSPVPSVDGNTKILFCDLQPSGNEGLQIMNTDGTQVTVLESEGCFAAWSPDATKIVVSRYSPSVGEDLVILDLGVDVSGNIEVTGETSLVDGTGLPNGDGFIELDWSSDGNYITTTMFDNAYLIPVENPSAYVNMTSSLSGSNRGSTFSADGSQILFSFRGEKPSCGGDNLVKSGRYFSGLLKMNVNGSLINGCEVESLNGPGPFLDWR